MYRRGVARTSRGPLQRLAATALAIIFLAVLAGFTASCGSDGPERVVPSGTVTTKTVPAEGFTKVSAGASFQLDLRSGEEFRLEISADDNLLPLVEAKVDGDTLRLGIRGAVSIDGNASLSAIVELPVLEAVELEGATRATLTGFREPGEVTIRASGASTVSGEVSAGTLVVALSGASRARLDGFALNGELSASGASRLELLDFDLGAATVEVSGASYAEIAVRDEINKASAGGASTILYKGDPQIGELDVSGASSVSAYSP